MATPDRLTSRIPALGRLALAAVALAELVATPCPQRLTPNSYSRARDPITIEPPQR